VALEVIELDDPRWAETVQRHADLFYLPEFCRFKLQGQAHRPVLLRYEDDAGVAFDVTTIREVARLPFYAAIAGQFSSAPIDLASPEYNGPIAVGDPGARSALLRRYRAAVDEYCRTHAVVTEFVRLHPFETAGADDTSLAGDVVYVDLREGYEAAAARVNDGHRRTARRAAREGARFEIAPSHEERIRQFAGLYLDTMRRTHAKSVSLHSPDYFLALFRHLGTRAVLAESYSGSGRLASAIVLLVGDRRVWYKYGGTVEAERSSGANTLLFDRLFAWAAERGLDAFVLGGGLVKGDGLYRNKLGYSPFTASVRHLRKIHDPEALTKLEAGKAAYDARIGRQTPLDYFPSYWL
jgi:hypothetical protein